MKNRHGSCFTHVSAIMRLFHNQLRNSHGPPALANYPHLTKIYCTNLWTVRFGHRSMSVEWLAKWPISQDQSVSLPIVRLVPCLVHDSTTKLPNLSFALGYAPGSSIFGSCSWKAPCRPGPGPDEGLIRARSWRVSQSEGKVAFCYMLGKMILFPLL